MAGSGFLSILKAFRTRNSPVFTNIYNDNRNADLSCDRSGNLWVREAIGPQSGATGFTYQAVPADNEDVIRSVPVILTQIGGFNNTGSSIFVQIFDRTTAPPAATPPLVTFLVPDQSSFNWQPSRGGRLFFNGLVFGVSSTQDIYTSLALNIFLFAEGYIQ